LVIFRRAAVAMLSHESMPPKQACTGVQRYYCGVRYLLCRPPGHAPAHTTFSR
jgi:hypothetical protein